MRDSENTSILPEGRSASDACSDWADEISHCIETLPTPTTASWQLYWYLAEPNPILYYVVESSRQDPCLSVELLRLANAAQFARGRVDSVEEAVLTLGLKRVRKIALRLALRSMMPAEMASYQDGADDFFRKSVACAAAMDLLHSGESDAGGEKYTVGLLHAIGEVFIDAVVSRQEDEPIHLRGRSARKLAEVEKSFLGLDQAQVAGMALRSWNFPASVYGPIEQQFKVRPDSPYLEAVQSLSMARFVASKVAIALRGSTPISSEDGPVVFRGFQLSEVFEYAYERCANEAAVGLS